MAKYDRFVILYEHLREVVEPELDIKPEVTINIKEIPIVAKNIGIDLKESEIIQILDDLVEYFRRFKISVFRSSSNKFLIFRKGFEEIIQKSIFENEIDTKIEISGPKEFVEMYESFFHGIGSALYVTKVFPELKDVIFHILTSENEDIFNEVKGILDEQGKYI